MSTIRVNAARIFDWNRCVDGIHKKCRCSNLENTHSVLLSIRYITHIFVLKLGGALHIKHDKKSSIQNKCKSKKSVDDTAHFGLITISIGSNEYAHIFFGHFMLKPHASRYYQYGTTLMKWNSMCYIICANRPQTLDVNHWLFRPCSWMLHAHQVRRFTTRKCGVKTKMRLLNEIRRKPFTEPSISCTFSSSVWRMDVGGGGGGKEVLAVHDWKGILYENYNF